MNLTPKSRLVSLLLTIFLGPLGLLYSSVTGSIILLILTIITFASVVGPLFFWVLAIAIGDHCTHKHNKNIENIKELVSNKG